MTRSYGCSSARAKPRSPWWTASIWNPCSRKNSRMSEHKEVSSSTNNIDRAAVSIPRLEEDGEAEEELTMAYCDAPRNEYPRRAMRNRERFRVDHRTIRSLILY